MSEKDKDTRFYDEGEIEIEKEIALSVERHRLSEIIELLKNEILLTIEKRKKLIDKILQNRKGNVEEYKDDEDKIIEYFDHDKFIDEEAFNTYDRRLKQYLILESSPYFGKVDFMEEAYGDKESIYIGRFGMTPENSYEPVIIDWRAPVASLFYTEGLGKASYTASNENIQVDIKLKRQFIIKNEKLAGMFDSDIDIKDEVLKMVLSKNSGQKLKDIIMTIQAEQDKLIRQPKEKTIVIDGIAGSGKTTVALHRAAYLLYNYRENLKNRMLIIGPNSIFMDYISNVLPSLGEIGVKQMTFRELAMSILNIDDVMSLKDYMELTVNKDQDFIDDILYKTSDKYIEFLDKVINYLNEGFYKIVDFEFKERIIVTEKEISQLFNVYYAHMPLIRRIKKIKRILYSKLKDARDEEFRRIEKEYKEKLSRMTPDQLEADANQMIYRRKLMIRELIQQVMKAKKSLDWLSNIDYIDSYNRINKNKQLTEHDLAPILYLKTKLEGYKLKEEYKHIIIDEAQDYSKLQLMLIKELTGCNAFTIVGDSNQRIVPVEKSIAMKELKDIFKGLNIEEFGLNRSYRSTKQIMNFAGRFTEKKTEVSLIRDGKEVTEMEFSSNTDLVSEIINSLNNFKEEGYESIGIVCKSIEETEELGKMIKRDYKVTIIDNEDIILSEGISVLPYYYAKGLEFDAVIIIDDKQKKVSNEIMYVMATRALHELKLFKI